MSRSRKRRRNSPKQNRLPGHVLKYFMNLETNDVADFIDHWRAVERHESPGGKELTKILFQSAKALVKKNKPKFSRARGPVKFIRHNIHMWEDKAFVKADALNPTQIVQILWGYANFGLIPSDGFMNKLFEVADKKKRKFELSDVKMGLWGLARMGVVPPESFLQNCRKIISGKNRYIDNSDMALIMWSLGVLDSIEPRDIYKKMYEEARFLAKTKCQFGAIQQQIRDCELWFRGHSDYKRPANANQNSGTISKLEIDLQDAFTRASLNSEKPKRPLIKRFKQAIDFPVSDGNKSLWVEVDGPTHYVFKPSTEETFYNGPTIFRSALINKFAPAQQVLRIGYKRIEEILEKEAVAQGETCRDIFRIFTAKPPGVYGINEPDQKRDTNIFSVAPRIQLSQQPHVA